MDTVQPGMKVEVHLVAKLEDGFLFDDTREEDPLCFVAGSDEVIPGLANGVVGLRPGETRALRVEPAEGYGERDMERVVEVPLETLPEETRVGDQLQTQLPEGETLTVFVHEVREDVAVLDANHPFAGQVLLLEVSVVRIVSD